MENAPAVQGGSLDDLESIADSDFTDGLESPIEYDFGEDEDCDDNWDNSDGCLDDDGSIPDSIVDCNTDTLKDFAYENEGKIYAEGHAIRLIRLVGGTGPIQACLFKAFLHKSLNEMPYEALSYAWGPNEKTKQITLNGERFMVTKNLYSALQYLRFKNQDRVLWIDAICIDQSHTAERNHQVSHMASIYHDADRVIFWLGEPTYETDLLISSLRRLQARASNTPNMTPVKAHDSRWRALWNDGEFYENIPVLLRGLVSLLARPWFRRSWILQEVCLAKTGVIACGTKAIAAHIFALASWLLDLNPEAHCKAVLDMMPGATRSARTFLSGREMRNFYSLLRRFYRSEATDPRDQVFALLSMATDSNIIGFPGVDYGKKFNEVINSIFTYLFPKSWNRCGRSHSYQSLSQLVKDFPRLREAEIEAADDDTLSTARLLDDTELTQLDSQKAFRIAIQTGNAELLQTLLRFLNINWNEEEHYKVKDGAFTSSRFLPPLCAAAACGFTDVVKVLTGDFPLDVAMGRANVDSRDKSDRTPLLWAVQNGHEAVVKLLLATGKVDVDSRDKSDRTPLLWAAQKGHEAVVKLLLATGKVDVDAKDKGGLTSLLWAAIRGDEAVVKLLLTTGKADVDAKDEGGLTSLLWAAIRGDEAVVKLLLTTGKADVDAKDKYGITPLLWAAQKGHEAVVKLLLATGKVDVDAKDEGGLTSLLWAAMRGDKPWSSCCSRQAKLMLTRRINTVSRRCYVKMWLSCRSRRAKLTLTEYEFDQTLLSRAVLYGDAAMVKTLIAIGKADINGLFLFGI